jgi:hypothetical protein
MLIRAPPQAGGVAQVVEHVPSKYKGPELKTNKQTQQKQNKTL